VQRSLFYVLCVHLLELVPDERSEQGCMHSPLMQLAVLQAMWSECAKDSVADNNVTRKFCTEALTIQAPRERMSDR